MPLQYVTFSVSSDPEQEINLEHLPSDWGHLGNYLSAIVSAQRDAFIDGVKITQEDSAHKMIDQKMKAKSKNFHSDSSEREDFKGCTVIEVWSGGYLYKLQYADHIIPRRKQTEGIIRPADIIVGEIKHCQDVDASLVPQDTNALVSHYPPFNLEQFNGYKGYLLSRCSQFLIYAIVVVDREKLWVSTRFIVANHADDGLTQDLLRGAFPQLRIEPVNL